MRTPPPRPDGYPQIRQTFGDPTPFVTDKAAWESMILATRRLPVALPYAYDPGAQVSKVRAHRLIVDELVAAITECLDAGVPASRLVYGGCYCWRAKRTSPRLSLHCLTGGTLVDTDAGVSELAALRVGDMVATYPDGDIRGVTRTFGPRRADTLTIKTRTRSADASEDHPFAVLRFNPVGPGQWHARRYWIEWCAANALRKGDLLVLSHGSYTPSGAGAASLVDAELAGAFIGDGNVIHRSKASPSGVSFSVPQTDRYRERVRYLMTTVFGRAPRENATSLVDDRLVTSQWAMRLGLDKPARDKTVPDWVWLAGHEAQVAFLRGYICTDGTVTKNGTVAFHAGSSNLIRQLRALLIRLGFGVGNISEEPPVAHQIRGIPTVSRERWSFQAWDRGDVLRPLAHERHDERLAARWARLRKHRHGRSRGRGATWLPEGFSVEAVTNIVERGRRPVYDVTVDERHNFIADGLVVSNCWGIAVDLAPAANPLGQRWRDDGVMLDRRIVDTFQRRGWKWGDEFTRPDPQHWQFAVGA